MRVAFYCGTKNISGVDMTHLERGNPGIGGTEFQIFALAQAIAKESGFDVLLLVSEERPSPLRILPEITVRNEEGAANYATESGVDVVVFRSETVPTKPIGCKAKFVTIFHNEPSFMTLRKMSKRRDIDAVIFLTRQAQAKFSFFRIVRERSFICPLLPLPSIQHLETQSDKKEPIVGYVGNFHPSKGLHVLAEAWPYVLKKVSNAKLWIIGGDNLYGDEDDLRAAGLFADGYREKLARLLEPHKESVTFFGVLRGEELESKLRSIQVGVPKPVNLPETFCLVATDFERHGIPMVVWWKSAFREVVPRRGCLRMRGKRSLARAIVRILSDEKMRLRMSREVFAHYSTHYQRETVVPMWTNAICSVVARRRATSFIHGSRFFGLETISWLFSIALRKVGNKMRRVHR